MTIHFPDDTPTSYAGMHLRVPVGLDEIILKVTQSIKKVLFQKISEISLDKFEMIWSMEKRERKAKGEKVDGSEGLLWFTKGDQPQ